MVAEASELILFVLGLIFSGFFSGSEAALMSISVNRTRQLIEEGGPRGRAMQFLLDKPNEILTTILVGNNIVNIYVASLTTAIAARYFANDAVAISVGVTTVFILIFGEIIPKTFARSQAENLALPIIRILQVLYWVLSPIVLPFMWFVQKVLGKSVQLRGRITTKEDIEFMVNKAEKEKSIDSKQIDLLNSILEFPTIKVKDIMVPRQKVVAIKKGCKFEEVISLIREYAHSRYPVFENDLDNITGFLHVKDLAFVTEERREKFDVNEYLKEPFFVYEHMKIQAIFDHMNKKKVHLALVKDENGLVVGIITLEDIMEEIFGEIQDEHDDEEDSIVNYEEKSDSTSLTVRGEISLRDLNSEYDIEIPLNDNYSTLTGFLLNVLGNNFPKAGQIILWGGFSFELSKVLDDSIIEVTIKNIEGERIVINPEEREDLEEDLKVIEAEEVEVAKTE